MVNGVQRSFFMNAEDHAEKVVKYNMSTNALSEHVEKKLMEEHWPRIQKATREKVAPAALAAAKDDKMMQLLLTPVYMTLPFPVRLVIKKEVFMKFCFEHRERLIY